MNTVILWLAMPRGIAERDPSLRVSLFVSPQFSTTNVAETPFANWPTALEQLAHNFKARFDGLPGQTFSCVWDGPEPNWKQAQLLWRQLFGGAPAINAARVGMAAQPAPAPTVTHSFPTTPWHDDLLAFYRRHATADDVTRLPARKELQSDPLLQQAADLRFDRTDPAPTLPEHMKQFVGFHNAAAAVQPPTTPLVPPAWDLPRKLGALGKYPLLMRKLGLVIDLKIQIDPKLLQPKGGTPSSQLSIAPEPGHYPVGIGATDIYPWTVFDLEPGSGWFGARPTARDNEVLRGLLTLGAKDGAQPRYSLGQVDLDGGAHQLAQFAQTVHDAQSPADEPLGVPAPRTSGFELVRNQRQAALQSKIAKMLASGGASWRDSLNTLLATLAPGTQQTPWNQPFYAEDLMRGMRVDVGIENKWYSLCSRSGTYTAAGIDPAQHGLANVIDEGTVALAATTTTVDGTDLLLHESIFRWQGWSLCVERPGAPVPRVAKDKSFAWLTTTFKVPAGTLPKQRFGTRYRFRARMVDLAGNSLGLDEATARLGQDADTLTLTADNPYVRFEPLLAPVLYPATAERNDGVLARVEKQTDAIEELIIHSPGGPSGGAVATAAYHIAPPAIGLSHLEHHGTLDQRSYQRLIAVEKQSSLKALDQTMRGGELTFVPDPCAGAMVLWNLPGAPAGPDSSVRFRPSDQGREQRAVRLELEGGSGAPSLSTQLPENKFQDVLTVQVPPARSFDVEIASVPASAIDDQDSYYFDHFAIYQWLQNQPQQLKMAQQGQHRLMTPRRTLKLTHAVQRPLLAPVIDGAELATRAESQTRIEVRCDVTLHPDSTGKLDFVAAWRDRQGDGSWSATQTTNAFDFALTGAPPNDGKPAQVTARGAHPLPDTRHRKIAYRAVATTRFASYFQDSFSSDPKKVTTPAVAAFEVSVPSSARPLPPVIHSILPAFQWSAAEEQHDRWSQRRGGQRLRVYLDGDWYSSGDGEQLAVVLGLGVTQEGLVAAPYQPYVTQWAADPIWGIDYGWDFAALGPFPAAPTRDDFPGAAHAIVPLREIGADVDLSCYPTTYDANRRLHWVDIELRRDRMGSYLPFVRLALARYQPSSRGGCELSPVALADFVQLTPDRAATVTFANDRRSATVTVTGIIGRAAADPQWAAQQWATTQLRVSLQVQTPPASGDLGWTTIQTAVDLQPQPSNGSYQTWISRSIDLTHAKGTRRLLIEEVECYATPLNGPSPAAAERPIFAAVVRI